MATRIPDRTIIKTLQGEQGRSLDYCFTLGDAPQVWDPKPPGGFVWFFVDDDLFLACVDFIENKLKRSFASVEELREYAHANKWENLASFDRAIDAWIGNRDAST